MPARTRSTIRHPFQRGDGSDDDHDGPAQRAAGVDLLAEADELEVEPVQLVQHLEEVPDRAGDPLRGPDMRNAICYEARVFTGQFASEVLRSAMSCEMAEIRLKIRRP